MLEGTEESVSAGVVLVLPMLNEDGSKCFPRIFLRNMSFEREKSCSRNLACTKQTSAMNSSLPDWLSFLFSFSCVDDEVNKDGSGMLFFSKSTVSMRSHMEKSLIPSDTTNKILQTDAKKTPSYRNSWIPISSWARSAGNGSPLRTGRVDEPSGLIISIRMDGLYTG